MKLTVSSRRFALAAVLLTMCGNVLAQQSPPTGREMADMLEAMRRGAWAIQDDPAAKVKDSRGRTQVDDTNQWLLLPGTIKAIEEIDRKSQPLLGDPEAYRQSLRAADPLIATETYKWALVRWYWRCFNAISLHATLLEPWLAAATEADRKALHGHLDATRQDLVRKLETGLADTSPSLREETIRQMSDLVSGAARFYNLQRLELVRRQPENALAGLPKDRDRETPCPPATEALQGKTAPTLNARATQPDAGDFYPESLKHLEVTGPVVVKVRISANGCMEHAAVIDSSGVAELDQAALRYSEMLIYRPAAASETDATAAPGSFMFRVKFQLVE